MNFYKLFYLQTCTEIYLAQVVNTTILILYKCIVSCVLFHRFDVLIFKPKLKKYKRSRDENYTHHYFFIFIILIFNDNDTNGLY